jgi:DnaJ-class molecular chaperone
MVDSANDRYSDEGDVASVKRSLYLTLGCGVAEDDDSFRHAFHELAKHYHPDRVGPSGTPFLREIAEAYRVLSDFERKNDYDLGLRDARELADGDSVLRLTGPDETESGAALPVVVHFLHDPQIIWPSLDSVYEQVRRNFIRGELPRHGQAKAVDVQIVLTLEDALTGGTVVIGAPNYYPCRVCRGSGVVDECSCLACRERGVIEENETVFAAVPSSVRDHEQIELPLCGLGLHGFYLRLNVDVGSR